MWTGASASGSCARVWCSPRRLAIGGISRGSKRTCGTARWQGKPIPLRLRHFRPDASSYLASLGGPPPYMARLREIAALTAEHEQALAEAYEALGGDPSAWRALAERWDFSEVNDLIDRHNRWYPAEARLPMDPRTGDHVLVNGEHYSKRPLDATWVLERFPPVSSRAPSQRA